jgi:hypothetical protein
MKFRGREESCGNPRLLDADFLALVGIPGSLAAKIPLIVGFR